MVNRKFILFLLILFSCLLNTHGLFSQATVKNNFNYLFKASDHDTIKVNALLNEGKQYLNYNNDSALCLFLEALKLSSKVSFNKGKGYAHLGLGLVEINKGNSQLALEHYTSALFLFDSLKDSFNSAVVKYRMGSLYNTIGDYSKALNYLQKSLTVIEKSKDKKLSATILNAIGLVHYNFLNDEKAIEYYTKAYNIREELGDSLGMAVGLFNIANIYLEKINYLKANDYYTKSLNISEKINDSIGIAYCYLNIGVLNQRLKKNDLALKYFKEADKIQRSIDDPVGLANTLIYIGLLYIDIKDYGNAIEISNDALNLAKENSLLNVERDANNSLATIYEQKKDFEKAFIYFKTAKLLSDSLYNSEKSEQMGELETKYQTEKKQKEIELLSKDKELQNIEMKKQKVQKYAFIGGFFLMLAFAFMILRSYRIKKKANRLLLEKNAEISQQKEEIMAQADQLVLINNELEKLSIVASETNNSIVIADPEGNIQWVNNGFTKLFGYSMEEFISLFGNNIFNASSNEDIQKIREVLFSKLEPITYTVSNTNKSGTTIWIQTTLSPYVDKDGALSKIIAIDADISELKKAEKEILKSKNELEIKNKQIIDSINYAQLIQESILPTKQQLESQLQDYFVFYKPKNIVSGDFYWSYSKDNLIYIAVVDCTGHGVPGALMSMLGTSLLNEIVLTNDSLEPSVILDYLNEKVIYSLKQSNDMTSQEDGMDISLCRIDKKKNEILFANTNQTIVVFSAEGKVSLFNEEAFSIGGMTRLRNNHKYSNFNVPFESGSSVYMFSDGFVDQFGGEKNEKFQTERMVNILEKIIKLPMQEQLTFIEKTFNEWKGSYKQIDDVTLFGFRL